jgi:hypothetical protein
MAAYYEQGNYPVRIVGQYFDESKYGMQFCLKIQPSAGQSYERTVYLSLTDEQGNKAQYYDKTLDVLAYLGFAEERFEKLDPQHPQCCSFVGREVSAYCKHKPDGKGGTKEVWYIDIPKAKYEPKPVDSSRLRKLNAMFGKDMKERAKREQAKPPQTQATEPEPFVQSQDDAGVPCDDIPF